MAASRVYPTSRMDSMRASARGGRSMVSNHGSLCFGVSIALGAFGFRRSGFWAGLTYYLTPHLGAQSEASADGAGSPSRDGRPECLMLSVVGSANRARGERASTWSKCSCGGRSAAPSDLRCAGISKGYARDGRRPAEWRPSSVLWCSDDVGNFRSATGRVRIMRAIPECFAASSRV